MMTMTKAVAACAGTIALACAVVQPAKAADLPQYPQYGGPPVEQEVYQQAPRAYYAPPPVVYQEYAPPAVVPYPYYVPRRVYGYPGYRPYAYGYRPYAYAHRPYAGYNRAYRRHW
jgi:hypothetical protein